ncbi:MAG: hypothetical protein D6761_00425 [Candidatus Dadabacteria bacterium]|nr:MAG: hypothetical protein D6761_00425 [Candidatus Dadabacteria bacterium]
MKQPDRKHWLDDPRHVTWLWRGLVAFGLFVTLLEPLIDLHPHFEVENQPFFYDWFPFFSYVFIVLFSKELRKLLWRPADYYERETEDDS